MHRGGDKLRVAANGASNEVPDQKLSRLEAADEQWRIDTELILNRFSVNSLPISTSVRSDRTLNVGVRFRVLNIFVIIPMFSFSLRVIPEGAKPVPSIKLTARVSAQLGPTAYPILLGKIH
ncbi:hypothetical protein PIB30_088570 [Stylosanthes scabra]|uniref:Uncharacterized protein n=1 Tax=Stylosanthes scabra TaxID=79078 RepID=A0ABU6SUH4_9FABA|nr:hypothetical protein [Stylosanthes scabra]